MKRLMVVALMGGLALAVAAGTWAAGVPWKADVKKDDAGAGAADAAGGGSDLKTAMEPAQYARVIKPIEAKVEAAQAAMKPYEKEMEKPEDKRNQKVLLACKDRAATAYLSAALAAKKAIGMVKDEGQKAAIKEQYEDPNNQKAIEILLEIAAAAQEKNDLRTAVAYYKRVLGVDKENAQAKEGLTRMAEQLKQAQADAKKSGNKGGGSEEKKSWEQGDHSTTGRTTDWSKSGRGTW